MKHLQLFEGFTYNIILEGKRKKDKKWLKKAGALHKTLDVKEDESIPIEKINSKIEELEKDDKKLDKKESKLLRRLLLAKTMKKFSKKKKDKEDKKEDKKEEDKE